MVQKSEESILLSSLVTMFVENLFPLDRCGWFRTDVIDHAVDSLDTVDDLIGDFGQEVVRQVYPVSRHTIRRGDCTQRNAVFVGTFIAHYSDRLYRQQHDACLPNLIVQISLFEVVDENFVSLLKDFDLFSGNLTQMRMPRPGPGNG